MQVNIVKMSHLSKSIYGLPSHNKTHKGPPVCFSFLRFGYIFCILRRINKARVLFQTMGRKNYLEDTIRIILIVKEKGTSKINDLKLSG